MAQVNIHEAKTHLSRLLEQAEKGEEIVIARAGRPIAKLVPIAKPGKAKRKPGALKGKIKLRPGWDAQLTKEELALFYEGKLFP